MATYSSQELREGVINAETFAASVPVTMQFINGSSGGGGYFTVEASGSTYSFNSDAYDSGPLDAPGTDNLMLSLTSNPTDLNPIFDPNLVFDLSTSGDGTGGKMNITFTGGAGTSTLTSCKITTQGSNYKIGDTISIPAANLNAKSGASTTTDLEFKLVRNNINPQFNPNSQANVSGVINQFSGEFNLEFPPNSGNIISGSGLIQSGNKWSIPIPPGPFAGGANNPKLTWRPVNNIGPGALVYYSTGEFGMKM